MAWEKINTAIGACIVTYNPDIQRLEENICAIRPQVSDLCIVDNHSKNLDRIERLCKENDIALLKNIKNEGMAFALNRGAEYIEMRGGIIY